MDISGNMTLLSGMASLMKGTLVMKLEKKWKRGNGEIVTTNKLKISSRLYKKKSRSCL